MNFCDLSSHSSNESTCFYYSAILEEVWFIWWHHPRPTTSISPAINQISEPISTASYVINAIQSAMATIDRIFEIIDEPNELPDSQEQHLSSPKGAIEFKEVRFGYTPDKQLMENVTISVKPKQTLRSLAPLEQENDTREPIDAFYELTKGKIEFDLRSTSPSYQEMSCESILGWSYSILGCLKELLPRISPTETPSDKSSDRPCS